MAVLWYSAYRERVFEAYREKHVKRSESLAMYWWTRFRWREIKSNSLNVQCLLAMTAKMSPTDSRFMLAITFVEIVLTDPRFEEKLYSQWCSKFPNRPYISYFESQNTAIQYSLVELPKNSIDQDVADEKSNQMLYTSNACWRWLRRSFWQIQELAITLVTFFEIIPTDPSFEEKLCLQSSSPELLSNQNFIVGNKLSSVLNSLTGPISVIWLWAWWKRSVGEKSCSQSPSN